MVSHKRELTVAALAAIIFFDVAGTPAGLEDSIVAAGPFYALLGFLVFPLIWSVPEALICAEMATMFPEDAGFVTWVSAAFGTNAGYVEGIMSWLSGVTDNSIYPVFIMQYAATLSDWFEEDVPYHVCLAVLIVLLTITNYLGLKLVGRATILLMVFSLLPFAVMVCGAIPHLHGERIVRRIPFSDVNWGLFLNSLFWNLNYFDSASTLAAEVKDPTRTFPKALFISVSLIVGMYLLVIVAVTGTSPVDTNWEQTSLSNAAHNIGGKWLQTWTVVAIAVSSVGMFQAEMSTDSYQLLGMAERGMIPKVFSKRSRFGTPTAGIVLGTFFLSVCALLTLTEIIEMLNLLYCVAALLEFAAFLYLRFKRPDIDRPYRVPLSNIGCVLLLLPTTVFTVVIICYASWKSLTVAAGSILLSGVIIAIVRVSKNRKWCEYCEEPDWEESIDESEPLLPTSKESPPRLPAYVAQESSVNAGK